jgi:hypothetical protein
MAVTLPFRSWGLDIELVRETVLVRFLDPVPLDEAALQALRRYLVILMREGDAPQLMVNFRLAEIRERKHVEKLATFHQRLKALSGQLNLCQISGQLYEFVAVIDQPRLASKEAAQALQDLLTAVVDVRGHAARSTWDDNRRTAGKRCTEESCHSVNAVRAEKELARTLIVSSGI